MQPIESSPIDFSTITIYENQRSQQNDDRALRWALSIACAASLIIPAGIVWSGDRDNKAESPTAAPHPAAEAVSCTTAADTDIMAIEALLRYPLQTYSSAAAINNDSLRSISYRNDMPSLNEYLDPAILEHLDYAHMSNLLTPFFKRYGVTVAPISDQQIAESQAFAISKPLYNELNNETSLSNLYGIALGLSNLSTGYVQQIGLKHILLASSITSKDDNTGDVAFAKTDGAHDTIVQSLSGTFNPYIILHEIGHLDDTSSCGGAVASTNDLHFTRHNGGDIYIGDKDDKTVNRMQQHLAPSWTARYDVSQRKANLFKDTALPCKVILSRLATIKTVTDYGNENVSEDKAEVYSRLYNIFQLMHVVDSRMPHLRAKAVELLARMYHKNPTFVRQLVKQAAEIETVSMDICN